MIQTPLETEVFRGHLRRLGATLLLFLTLGAGESALQTAWAQASSPTERSGTWRLVPSESSPIDPWNTLVFHLDAGPRRLVLIRRWHGPTDYTAVDSVRIPIDGEYHRAPLPDWPDNRHIGAFANPDRPRRVAAKWLDDGRTLRVTSRFWVDTSQGQHRVRTYTEYRIAPDGNRLVVLELRSTRPTPRRYVLERSPNPKEKD